MMTSGVSLLAELLEIIFQDNRELLLELNIANVIAASKRENSALDQLVIGPELQVNANNLAENPISLSGMASIVFTVREYLEVFLGRSEADARVGRAVAKFVAAHESGDLAKLRESFPEIFSINAVAPDAGLEDLGENEKVGTILLALLKKASPAVKEACEYLKSNPSVLSFPDDMSALAFASGVEKKEVLEIFSEAIDRLGMAPARVKDFLSSYGTMPDELGITDRILGGALSRTTRFGCPNLDALLRDGLIKDSTVLLEGPAGAEKEVLASMFLSEGLRRNGCAIIVSTSSDGCIQHGLEASGLNMKSIESEGRFIKVDWHSRFTQRITSIDISGNVLKISNDLTNLAVGIDMALKMASKWNQVRLVMDIASQTMMTEGFDRVHDFLNSVRAKMKNHNCTGLILLNNNIHTAEETTVLEEVFDGTMLIERAEQDGTFRSNLRITHLSGTAFSPARLSLKITHRGLEISGVEGMQPEYVVFDRNFEKAPMGLLGIESLSPGGLPVGKNYLVWMPSSLMPPDFVRPVVVEAQKDGHAILLALSSVDTDSIGEWISETGLSRKGLIDRGLLQVVDWYGQKSAKVLGMEMDDGMIRTSRDLTHLGVGIDMALRKIGDQSPATALMEIHSQAIRLFDFRSLYSFAQSVNAKLTDKGYTAFMLMERNAHDGSINAAMEELFDGIIDIRSSAGNLEIAIVSIRGSHVQPEYRTLTRMREKLTIDVSKRIPEHSAGADIPGHGLALRLKELEAELEKTVGQKGMLEKRLAEMSVKESEYQGKHDEMKTAMQEIENRMAAEREEADNIVAVNPDHKAEMSRLLKIMDEMLEKLPADVIDNFAKSEDFKLYEKIIKIYLEEER